MFILGRPENSRPSSALSLPLSRTALVAEGGGQRGIYTAGVLDSWLQNRFNPFSILIGTSAGAQNLSSYVTSQKGFARHAIFGLTSDPGFFQLRRTLTKQHVIDLDWYFDQFEKKEVLPLDVDHGVEQLKSRKLYFTATRASDREAFLFSPNKENWLKLLKASSVYPLLYRQGVEIGDHHYIDGGLSAPLPVQQAYDRGAKRIVVIRIAPKNTRVESPWAHKWKSWLCKSNRCPKVIDLITHHENAYKAAQDFIDNPPDDVEIIQVHPDAGLRSKVVNSPRRDLQSDYNRGFLGGLDFLEKHGEKLSMPNSMALCS